MLSQAENELLTRAGPDTPMGNLMRRFWLPFALSTELREPDSDPVRVRLLGEDLIAFGDTTGNVGLMQNNCPHRGASLFYGRNEESGLRCVYHGWRFDTDGNCVDMPNGPAESDFKATCARRPTRWSIAAACRGHIWGRIPTRDRSCQGSSGRSCLKAIGWSPSASSTAASCRTSRARSTPVTCRSCTVAIRRRISKPAALRAPTWRAIVRRAFSCSIRTTDC